MKIEENASSTGKKKRVRDKDEKIRKIYTTFFDLLKQRGYANVSTNHVAEAAGISIGTVYRYFPNGKVDIMKNYYDSMQTDILDLENALPGKDGNIFGFFRKFISQFVRVHRDNLVIDQAYEQAMLENREALETYKQKVDAFIGRLAEKMHQSAPPFSAMPIDQIKAGFLVVYNVFEALTRQHLVVMPLFPTDEEFTEFLTRLLEFFFQQGSRDQIRSKSNG